jgi:bifunctional DNase/RNase
MLVPAEVWTIAKSDAGSAVLIKPVGSDVAVPIFIGPAEAHSILIGLANHKMPRPFTHDLFLSTLKQTGITIKRIEITELKEGTFYARLLVQRSEEELSIDARPSDCIALAVRVKCPIYIDEAVVDETGIPLSSGTQEMATRKGEMESQLITLRQQLREAVEVENYEEAAVLRDRINKLQKDIE